MSENGQYVAGHLQEKKGKYYIVLNYKDSKNNRKSKWISTGLPGRKGQSDRLICRGNITNAFCRLYGRMA